MSLHPTLWRTCRALGGKTRLELFRLVADQPGQTVAELARTVRISRPRASQELRRLQSRGLLKAVREGRFVRYHPVSDPLVPTAKPILQAMLECFRRFHASADSEISKVAAAFSHSRRIAILCELAKGPRSFNQLASATGNSAALLDHHLEPLQQAGLIMLHRRSIRLADTTHPLAQCLIRLAKKDA